MRRRDAPRGRALSLVALLGLSLSCGATSAGRTARAVGVEVYSQASGWRPEGPVRSLYDAVVAATSGAGEPVSPDPALHALASEVARRVASDPRGRTPSARVLQALSWQLGITDPLPAVLVLRASGGADAGEALRHDVERAVRGEGYTHVGVARRDQGEAQVVAITLAQRRMRLEPTPRRVSQGARIVVRGALLGGLRSPGLAVVHPGGRIEEVPLGEGPEFFGQLPASERGAWQIELTAVSPVGSTVVANFPVYVDAEPPATPEETSSGETEAPAAVEEGLFRQANQARAAAGLRPLELLPALSAVARGHSEDMARNRFVAHNSPTAGTAAQRLERAGLRSGLMLENVGRGYGARELHEGLMASPGHRANLLNAEVTHVGIGVAREEGPSGALFITQDFIAVAAPIEVETAARTLLESVNRARASRGAPTLEPRPGLMEVAREAARAYFAGGTRTEDEVLREANGRLGNQGLLFRRVALTGSVVTRLDEAARLEPLLDRTVRAVGVGVAQGDRPDRPPRSIFVVFVLAVPR